MSETPTAVRCEAAIATPNARRYMAQLCKHFQHKLPVTLDDRSGTITFTIGDCHVRAETGGLTLLLESPDDAQLAQLRDVIVRHLLRFAFREEMQVAWRAASSGESPYVAK